MPTDSHYKYTFSFVMPVYNVEDYIGEAINSILKQSIGFKNNCEIILVNDGSTDSSGEICQKYAQKYPDNIQYINQKNQGVSAARNKGISKAQGKYISFLDSDDKISPNTLAEVYDFFEKRYSEIDFCAIKMRFFDGREGHHYLNDKFKKTRIIDINKESSAIQLAIGPTFHKASAIKGKVTFDTKARFFEDAEFLCEIVMNKKAYGVVSGPTYYYRKPTNKTSASAQYTISEEWYFSVTELFKRLLEKYKKHPYIQNLVMYDVQWRFTRSKQRILSQIHENRYKKILYSILKDIDDSIILNQKRIDLTRKLFILEKKYGKTISDVVKFENNEFFIGDTKINYDKLTDKKVRITRLDIVDKKIIIEGCLDFPLLGKNNIYIVADDNEYKIKYTDTYWKREVFLNETVNKKRIFKVTLPLSEYKNISASIIGDIGKIRLELVLDKFTYINNRSNYAYKVQSNYIIRRHNPHRLSIYTHTAFRRFVREFVYELSIIKRLKLNFVKKNIKAFIDKELRVQQDGNRPQNIKELYADLKWIFVPIKSICVNFRIVFYRLVYFITRSFIKKEIWLLSDRATTCGDNADYLFRYIASLPKDKKPNAAIYFALNRDNNGYKELSKIGKVVRYDSFKYKILFLLATKRISSHFDYYIINAFGNRASDMFDLYSFDYIYLGHGVLTSDSSKFFGRLQKNAKLLTLASNKEKQSILSNSDYGYSKKNLEITGLPRFDSLISITSKTIIFMPTWRASLAGKVKKVNGAAGYDRQYSPTFSQTDYFKFYNSLMNDKKVLRCLKENGYKIEFYIHPSFSNQWKDFTSNEFVKIMTPPHDYVAAMRKAAAMVTDYSGVAFDFAYMKKPVIYTQYDKETLYEQHYYSKGYFDFERDGFGEVTYNYNDSVNAIINTIENDCIMSKKYQKRVDSFFEYKDMNNGKRVYEAIMEM